MNHSPMMRCHKKGMHDAHVERVCALADTLSDGTHRGAHIFPKILCDHNGLGSKWSSAFFAKRRLNRQHKTRKRCEVRWESVRAKSFRRFSLKQRGYY